MSILAYCQSTMSGDTRSKIADAAIVSASAVQIQQHRPSCPFSIPAVVQLQDLLLVVSRAL